MAILSEGYPLVWLVALRELRTKKKTIKGTTGLPSNYTEEASRQSGRQDFPRPGLADGAEGPLRGRHDAAHGPVALREDELLGEGPKAKEGGGVGG